jgi:hypothetical protein
MAAQRWHVELYEDQSNLEKVRECYHAAINALRTRGERIEVIDGNQPPVEVHRQLVTATKSFLRSVADTDAAKASKIAIPAEQLTLIDTSPLTESEIATHQEG